MSERYKSVYFYQLPSGGPTIGLTCHFKFEKATAMQKFDPALGGGREICNGCGPSGYGRLVPDHILGVCVTICGHIHNWGYQFGQDHEDKRIIDETFGDNMDRIIRADFELDMAKECVRNLNALQGAGWLKRKIEAWRHQRKVDYLKEMFDSRVVLANDVYEAAVVRWGKSAFWDKRPIMFTLDEVA